MGASNALRAYATYGSVLGDHALRALVYMSLVAADRDAEPWFGLGHEALSEFAFGRPVPDRDKDCAGCDAALRAVGRAMNELRAAGAIRTSERAKFGTRRAQNARYRLYLDAPCPEGVVPPPRRWRAGSPSDAECPIDAGAGSPVDNPVPSDTERPMAPDAGRPAAAETTGRFVTDHRTENDRPPDAQRPTKEEEEDEERINDGDVVGANRGRPPTGLQIIDNPTPNRRRSTSRAPGDRPLIPYAVEPLAEPAATADQSPPATSQPDPPPCGDRACDPVTRQRAVGDGTYRRCPKCHPLNDQEAAS